MKEKTEKKRILVAEDESIIAKDLRNSLMNMGYDVVAVVSSAEDAIALVPEQTPDLIIMDIMLQGEMDGIDAAAKILESHNIPVIYLTAYADDNILERAKITEPFGYMIKPFEEKELYFAIEMALYKHNMQEKLLEQSTFLENILNSLTHPFYVIDANDYIIRRANAAANLGDLSDNPTCYSITHHESKPCHSQGHPCPLQIVKKTRKGTTVEHIHYDRDGNARNFEVHCYPIFDKKGNISEVIEYSLDITERKRLEKQFLDSQKMESVGRLAGGVAHDFSNIMSAVLGYSEMALMEIPEDHPARQKLEIIRDAGEKAATLTRQLLAFSSKQVLRIKPVNINMAVDNMAKMLMRLIGEDIRLKISTESRREYVMADQGQIEQILMNLAINARDAMPGGGDLVIETADIDVDDEYAKRVGGIKSGPHIILTVTDSGEGISRDVIDKVFEPFFTTKSKEKGTGLGLATVYGIVKQHKGHISAYSETGKGTSFKIYIPAVQKEDEDSTEEQPKPMPGGNETVMVVDDEQSIRSLIVDTLKPLGYGILEAADGDEALMISESNKGKIDVLLTDVIMPGINGRELSKAISANQPGMKIIFMSGYTDNISLLKEILATGSTFLQKPLRPSTLANRLREVLGSEA